jgi:cellulose 1,4-beta-cellobiosidase
MKRLALAILLLSTLAFANTPGQSSVSLTWTDPDPAAATYNLYRGTVTGVCSGTPTPFAKSIASKSFVDSSVTAGTTYFYAVSAVSSAGKESACSTEVRCPVRRKHPQTCKVQRNKP